VIGVRRFGSGPPLVALHGFTLTGEQFAPAAARLGRTIIALDLPGHGRSTDAPTTLSNVIDLVASTVESIGYPVPVVGYSQGARIALMTALDRPAGVSTLVLVSANAGLKDATVRDARARSDAEMAERLSKQPLDDFLDTWTSTGITATKHLSGEDRAVDMAIRRQNTSDGLAGALIGYGQGAQPSLWHRLAELSIPVLVMSGDGDEKYGRLADAIADTVSDAERVTIVGAGHNPLLDQPDQAYSAISEFLDRRG
jgi:2-succinyl-6-hydroxy-2,4-cyclohexadiene-1-carboxylate synthase